MKCSVCGKDIPLTYRIKNKKNICCFCYKPLPKIVKDKLKKYNKQQIGKILENIDQSPKGCWINYESFGLCMETYNVILNGTAYISKNLTSIKYHFHPEKQVNAEMVIGYIIVELDFKNGMKVQESISSLPIGLPFTIKNKKVEFLHSEFFVSLINKMNDFIKSDSYDEMDLFYWEYLRGQARDADEERERKVEEEKERKAKEEAEYKRQQEEQRRREQQKRNSQQSSKSSGKMSYEEAKTLFGISGSCSSAELKKRRNQLLKKHHPDQGGSLEMCAKVNEAYRILSL